MNYTCDICEKVFVSKNRLLNHVLSSHSVEEINFKCDVCDGSFKTVATLASHEQKIHKESIDNKFCCSICLMTFKTSITLTTHKEVHQNIKEYECNLCGKTIFKAKLFESSQ